MYMVYFIASIFAGLLLDWAMYDRIVTTVGMPDIDTNGYKYVDLLFPRVIVTLCSIAVLFFAECGDNLKVFPFIFGTVMFVVSTLYGAYRYLWGR